jgi:hypothetical protein
MQDLFDQQDTTKAKETFWGDRFVKENAELYRRPSYQMQR